MYREVEYLTESTIEANAQDLLQEFTRDRYPLDSPPVPVEDLTEKHLGLTLDFTDLNVRFGGRDVIGALYAHEGAVYVDERLDPDEHPTMEGRCRFTVAHELGHWCQHRAQFDVDPNQGDLFGCDSSPSVVCREADERTRIEIQANLFAAALLMPRSFVYAAWSATYGSSQAWYGSSENEADFENVASALAQQFKVSRQAMRIRLVALGLFRCEAELAPPSFWVGN